jgi:hypothetical protein
MQGINHLTCKNTATVEAFKSSPDRPNQPQNNEVNPTQEKNKATQHNNDESTSELQHRLGKLGENLHLHIWRCGLSWRASGPLNLEMTWGKQKVSPIPILCLTHSHASSNHAQSFVSAQLFVTNTLHVCVCRMFLCLSCIAKIMSNISLWFMYVYNIGLYNILVMLYMFIILVIYLIYVVMFGFFKSVLQTNTHWTGVLPMGRWRAAAVGTA